MSNMTAQNEVIPVDIRRIRQSLGLTMREMGEKIALYAQGVHCPPIPHTRVNEWEFHYRPMPDYVFTACANILLDTWSEDRHNAQPKSRLEIDVFYGSILNQPLGELFQLEQSLGQSRNVQHRKMVEPIAKARRMQQRYLEQVLSIRMSHVFAAETGPFEDDPEME